MLIKFEQFSFSRSAFERILTLLIIFWYGNVTGTETGRFDKIVNIASLDLELININSIASKITTFIDDYSNLTNHIFKLLLFGT